jgi:hypothetical protein
MSDEENTTEENMNASQRTMVGTPTEEEDLDPNTVLAQANQAMKERWLAILIQFHNSKRYTDFIDNNFEIRDYINEEDKTIQTLVVEKPTAVGPKLAPGQIVKIHKLLTEHKAENVTDLVTKLFSILGQDEDVVNLIASANMDDVQAAAVQANLKGKLDA